MSSAKTVLAYGEMLWDLLPGGAVLGGAPFNFAYRCASLGERALVVSRLGMDDLGHEAFDRALALRMDTSYIQWDEAVPTGTVDVTLDHDGSPSYRIVPGVAYDRIEITDTLLQTAAAADCIYFGTLIQRAPRARHTLQALLAASPDSVKFLDVNLRQDCYTGGTLRLSLEQADIVKVNDEEARIVAGWSGGSSDDMHAFCRLMIKRWTLSHCLVTLGSKGAFAATAAGEEVYVPGYRVAVVDTCGSGDAFSAAFLHRYLAGKTLSQCCTFANAMGAIVAAQQGATAPINAGELEEFINAPPARIVEGSLEKFAAL